MKEGTKVVGVPKTKEVRDQFPTVCGYYKKTVAKYPSFTMTFDRVIVDEGVAISCTDIRPAGRRDKETKVL